MLSCGVEVHGMANGHLQATRRAIARAVSPEGGGKNFELVLHAADGANGTLDPAFDAHGLPIWMWALAHWEHWLACRYMHEAITYASSKVRIQDGDARWALVTGPSAAVVASASRIGWRFKAGHLLCTDQNEVLDLSLDPPIVVLQETRRAVRRWRLRNIGKLFPHFIPPVPDVVVEADRSGSKAFGVTTTALSFSESRDGLLQPRHAAHCKVFDGWKPKYRGYLRSAISGGQ